MQGESWLRNNSGKIRSCHSIPPGTQNTVGGHCRGRDLFCLKQFSSQKPAHACLRRAFGDAHRVGDRLVAYRNALTTAAGCFIAEPHVDEEAGWLVVMADEVAHQDVDN